MRLFPEVVALPELLRVRTDLELWLFEAALVFRLVVTAELLERLLVERLPDEFTAELPLDVPEVVFPLKEALRRESVFALRTELLFDVRSEALRPSVRTDELPFDERTAELRLDTALEREPDER